MRFFAVFLFAMFVGVVDVFANELPVLFINRDKVVSEALVAKDIRSQLDNRRSELQRTFSNRESELRKSEGELVKQKSILSSEAFGAKLDEFRKEVDRLQKDVASKSSELERMYVGAMDQVYDKIREISRQIATENKAQVVLFLPGGQITYTADSIDISDRVLEILNRDLSRVKMDAES